METITLKINKKSREGKTLMDLIDLFSLKKTAVQIVEKIYKSDNVLNEGFLESIEDFKNGRVIKAKSATELLKKLKS